MSRKLFVYCSLLAVSLGAATFDVRTFGAKADGKTQDRDAINKAVDAAAAAGGGTVYFPTGTYVTGSIRLRSNITLRMEHGTVLEASSDPTAYDPPEPNQWDKFQDFGHSHWHNSLIWGDGLENVSIVGGGLISGKALQRGERGGGGNKAIALKLCRNVRISNSSVNSPNDDAIVLKGSHALGFARPTATAPRAASRSVRKAKATSATSPFRTWSSTAPAASPSRAWTDPT